jgi:hypothetical protein
MTAGFIAYTASAALVGALYGGIHTNIIVKERDARMPALKHIALVTSGTVLGAILNPIALPFYPFLSTFCSLNSCPLRSAHKYV